MDNQNEWGKFETKSLLKSFKNLKTFYFFAMHKMARLNVDWLLVISDLDHNTLFSL
jgi:hypothetical protein